MASWRTSLPGGSTGRASTPKQAGCRSSIPGPVELLLSLRSAVAVHIVERFAVSRPRALLGHEHFNRLLGAIREVVGLHPRGTFKTFRVSAAGSDSGTFRRLRDSHRSST